MRRFLAPVLFACLTGCSNAPVAGFLDAVAPAPGGAPGTRDRSDPDVRPPDRGPDTLPPAADPVIPPVGPQGPAR